MGKRTSLLFPHKIFPLDYFNSQMAFANIVSNSTWQSIQLPRFKFNSTTTVLPSYWKAFHSSAWRTKLNKLFGLTSKIPSPTYSSKLFPTSPWDTWPPFLTSAQIILWIFTWQHFALLSKIMSNATSSMKFFLLFPIWALRAYCISLLALFILGFMLWKYLYI